MGLVELKLSDVKLSKPAGPDAGRYTLVLVPTAEVRKNKFTNNDELNLSASISDGEFSGRRVFWTYPDPATIGADGKPFAWSVQAMKKLQICLGLEPYDEESLADYFNRAALSDNNRFSASLEPETRKNKATGEREPYVRSGKTEPENALNIFSVQPAV